MKRALLLVGAWVCACARACGPEAWGVDGVGGVSATFGGQTFRAASAAPATVKAVSRDRVELELATDGGPVRAVWARDGEGALTLALSAPADQPMPKALAYPAGWETRAGDDLVLPFGEGVAYPATDGGVQFRRARFAFSNGMGVSMGFFGVGRGGVYAMTGVEGHLDAELVCRTNAPYRAGVAWRPVAGRWGHERRLRFFFGASLGAVAAPYRAWRERQGMVRTLAEKAKTNPHVRDFPGTADFWLWDDNNQNRLYNWPQVTPSAPLDVPRLAGEMKALGLDRVLLNAFEGLTAADCAALRRLGYLAGTYDCLRDVFHPGLLGVANPSNFVRNARFLPFADEVSRVNPDGSFARAWSIPDRAGNMHPMHALCDGLSLEMCRRLIAPEVAARGYTSRLMDVQAGGGPVACFSPRHPCTKEQALEALRAEHRYLSDDLGQIVGVEVGGELLVDAYHYSEGLTSCPHEFRKALCWRYKDQALYGDEIPTETRTLLHNPRYRVPLWELVYHDCSVSYGYWADSALMYPQLTELKDAFCRLWGVPPIYSMNVATWSRLKHAVAASYRRAAPAARATMFSRMTAFEYLTPDRLVQRTTFANGHVETVDFRDLYARVVAAAPGGFKILSYNVRHCRGMDGEVDVARTAAVLNRERPRFACLQEVDRGTARAKGADEAAELGRLTGMTPTFAKTIDYDGGAYGVLLLSRERPVAVRRVPLPGAEPRVLLLAEFADCFVGCTHLSVASAREREASAQLIAGAVAEAAKAKPVFVAGDWNALPGSAAVGALSRSLRILSETGGRTFHGAPDAGPSGTTTDFCIDYIAVDAAHADAFTVVDRGVVADRTTSDHAPVFVTALPSELRLNGASRDGRMAP